MTEGIKIGAIEGPQGDANIETLAVLDGTEIVIGYFDGWKQFTTGAVAALVGVGGGVLKFNDRVGLVTPAAGDYSAALITNTSAVDGDTVADALDTLLASAVPDGNRGDVTVSGGGTIITINPGAVTNAKQASVAAGTMSGRKAGAGAGDLEDLTPAEARTVLNVADGADVTGAGNVDAAGAVMNTDVTIAAMQFVIDDDAMAAASDTTLATSESIKVYVDTEIAGIGALTDGDKGHITVSAGGLTWQVNPGAITNTHMADAPAGTMSGRQSGAGPGAPQNMTPAQIRTLLNLEGMFLDAANYQLVFSPDDGAYVEAGNTCVLSTQGTASFPNRVGDAVNVIGGTDHDGDHPAGALWRAADSGYVAGVAEYAGLIGGYDCLNNQIGGWISGSNHSVLAYNTQGHAYIGGGSYNFANGGRLAILGSTNCAILDTGANSAIQSAIIAGRDCLITDNFYSVCIGNSNTLEAGSDSFVCGEDLTLRAGHVTSFLMGRDANSQGADTFTRGSAKLVTENDVRVWSKVFKARTTDTTLTNMSVNPTTFEAGKVYAGYVKVKLVGLHDDGASGDGGNVFNHVALEAETSFMWDEDSDHGNFNGGSNGSSPTFNLTAVGTDKIGVGTCQLAMNTGMLRVKVTGKAGTTINWVAEMEVVSTAALS